MNSKNPEDLRVLHLVEAFGGGVATVIAQYIDHSQVQHEVLARIRVSDVDMDDFSGIPKFKGTTSLVEFVKLWLVLRREDFDVVHAHSSVAGVIARVIRHPRARVVYTPHAFAFSGHKSKIVRLVSYLIEKLLVSRTDVALVVSDHEGLLFSKLGLNPLKIICAPHALEIGSERTGIDKPIQITAVGRIGFQKRPEWFLALKTRLEGDLPKDTRWIWIGDGDESVKREFALQGIHASGWLPIKEVKAHLGQSLVLFHAARYEGLPMVVIESMSLGTPVVASDIAPHRSIPSVFTFQSPGEAANLILDLAQNPELWLSSSRNAQSTIKEIFNAHNQSAALLKAYSEVLPTAAGRL